MIVKKLAVPFINEKLLQQVEHCYIATAAISDAGFDFIRSRIPTKSKMEIITGLDVPTSPEVLRRIWRNYQGRITLNIFTRNTFHANLYIFDLPYRKSVAFIGSGHYTLEGIKDNEELFYKVADAREIENLKSWFIGYYEFGQPLSESLIEEYATRYPAMKQREYQSRLEKKQFIGLTTGGFNWDSIKFRLQYFKKEDYLVLSSGKSMLTTPELQDERSKLRHKFVELHQQIQPHLSKLKLHASEESVTTSINPADHPDGQLRSLSIAYGRIASDLLKIEGAQQLTDISHLDIVLNQNDLSIHLNAGLAGKGKIDREYFKLKMIDVEYRKETFNLLKNLSGYWIDVACDRRPVETFQTEDAFWEFVKMDEWMYYNFQFGKSYSPGASELNIEDIADNIMKEFEKLAPLYHHMKSRN